MLYQEIDALYTQSCRVTTMPCKFGNTIGKFHINAHKFGALTDTMPCYLNYLITLVLFYKGIISNNHYSQTYFASMQSYHVQLRS